MAAPIEVGVVHGNGRRVIPITGGVVSGPRLRGVVVPGGAVDPALVYFRTTPVFEAPAGPHEWLTRHVFVGSAERHPDGVRLRFFAVM